MCLSGIIGGASTIIGASSSNKAAKGQQAAAAGQLALEGRIYDETTGRFQPYYDDGLRAQNALAFELGLGPRPMIGGQAPQVVEFQDTPEQGYNAYSDPTSPMFIAPRDRGPGMDQSGLFGPQPVTKYRVGDQVFNDRNAADAYAQANPTGASEYQGFQATPGYDFRRQSGIDAIDGSAASRGGLFSGATLKAQQTFGDNLASQEYGNYINRLSGMASGGQAAAGNAANAGANYAAGAGNAMASAGNASAAGAIGVGNALQGGLNTGLGLWQYQKQQAAGQNALGGGSGFGGIGIGGLY